LVICQDEAYHQELHARKRALEATGNANARHCIFCHEWEDVAHLVQRKSRGYYHRECNAMYEYARRTGTLLGEIELEEAVGSWSAQLT
jgi:hypothetical protein